MADSPRLPRSEAASRVINAAERLFGERGYEGVSIRDIAEAAGISKANVFHHFDNKWELYRAVVENCSGSMRNLLAGLFEEDQDAETLLAAFARGHLTRTLQKPCATQLFLRQLIDSKDADGRQLMESMVEENFALAAEALTELKRHGKLADHVDPHVLALVVLGSHLSYFLLRDVLPRLKGSETASDPDSFHRAMVALLMTGLIPPQDKPE